MNLSPDCLYSNVSVVYVKYGYLNYLDWFSQRDDVVV